MNQRGYCHFYVDGSAQVLLENKNERKMKMTHLEEVLLGRMIDFATELTGVLNTHLNGKFPPKVKSRLNSYRMSFVSAKQHENLKVAAEYFEQLLDCFNDQEFEKGQKVALEAIRELTELERRMK